MTSTSKQADKLKQKYGVDYFSRIAKMRKKIPGGGFRDPEVARQAGLKSAAVRKAKREQQQASKDQDAA